MLKKIFNKESETPLVSVGIPCYNRPEGLKKTLESITNQSYKKIEIIISNNASPYNSVNDIAQEYAKIDKRIRYFIQDSNIGAEQNFKFVLRRSVGEYFMWVADDDEREDDFISKMLDLGSSCDNLSTACCAAKTIRFQNGIEQEVTYPKTPLLLPEKPVSYNLDNFLGSLYPQIIYGLHRRVAIQWVLHQEWFDWFDCYFAIHQLSSGYQMITDPNYQGIISGIYGKEYTPKPFKPDTKRTFLYLPYFTNSCISILRDTNNDPINKMRHIFRICMFLLNAFLKWEFKKQPLKAFIIRIIKNILEYMQRILFIVKNNLEVPSTKTI